MKPRLGLFVAVPLALFFIVACGRDDDAFTPSEDGGEGTEEAADLPTLVGTITMTDDFSLAEIGQSCTGDRIRPDADVVVKDREDTILAAGKLGPGTVVEGLIDTDCAFRFEVPNVPVANLAADIYILWVSDIRAPAYTRTELEERDWEVAFFLTD